MPSRHRRGRDPGRSEQCARLDSACPASRRARRECLVGDSTGSE